MTPLSQIEALLKEYLDSREFYELMQAYRHSPLHGLGQTISSFEHVKVALLASLREAGAEQAKP